MKRRGIGYAAVVIVSSFRTIGLCLIAVLIPLTATAADITKTLAIGRRPGGMYALVSDSDRSICEPILKSLNKPYNLVGERYFNGDTTFAADVLFGSGLEVPWTRKYLNLQNVKAISIDFSQVQLANDGRSSALYQWGDDGVTTLYVLPEPIKTWSSSLPAPNTNGATLSPLAGTEILPDEFAQYFSAYQTSSAKLRKQIANILLPNDSTAAFVMASEGLNLTVLRVRGETVLLVAGEAESNAAVYDGKAFHAFVLLYHRARPATLICRLQGAF